MDDLQSESQDSVHLQGHYDALVPLHPNIQAISTGVHMRTFTTLRQVGSGLGRAPENFTVQVAEWPLLG
jgi:hypothetical protein